MDPTRQSTAETAASEAGGHPPTADRLPSLQFGLRSLLLLCSACSIFFSLSGLLGAAWAAMLLLFAAIVGAHVLGNALGTRLRDQADRDMRMRHGPDYRAMPAHLAVRRKYPHRPRRVVGDRRPLPESPPEHRLMLRQSLGWWPVVFALCGAAAGASLAAWGIAWMFPRFGLADRLLAVGSFAVLGGLACYLAGTFIQVALWPAARYYFGRRSGMESGPREPSHWIRHWSEPPDPAPTAGKA